MKKRDKINWPKAIIQIISFLLIPGLFEAQFTAIGTIVSCVCKGTVSWEQMRYSVWKLPSLYRKMYDGNQPDRERTGCRRGVYRMRSVCQWMSKEQRPMEKQSADAIDTVSGATYSSNGIIHATANALEIPEDENAPRPGRDLKNKQKEHGHIVKHTIESQEQYEVKEYEEEEK